MFKYRTMLRQDLQNAVKDPMLLLITLGPLLLTLIIRYGFPPLSDWIASLSSFHLLSYSDFITVVLMLLVPQLAGIAAGLLILDERDERLIGIYAVTPLMKNGYLAYRLILPIFISIVMSAVFLLFSGISQHKLENIAVLLLLVLETPILAMLMATFAANKVEGLAFSKMIGLTLLGAVFAYFVPEPWQLLAGVFPTYWPAKLYLEGIAVNHSSYKIAIYFIIGLLFHLLLLQQMFKLFWKKIEQ
ncbi:hypothetical protein BSK66_09985 [Paenibacillus odorifer]|uniref:Uncharacterized protein n=2 Tax=Paenibacillus TaxID=44249 RepID=A0A1R0XDN7_9BACL|nr:MULTISPECIES: hypothetical protein [Paenibacillus]ETT45449.1 hypothetical protein C171_32171 [Paenibacillus sp. FSL H8-237]OMD33190.1 hypothetical protein BJP51_12570 [Paenibacillus odorifer]OME56251.1 hypothetical protein BSK61_12285 [Paenibacillus odorifer]OME59669.1 hypothetical protein BSK66_09985 [Paenibacillus odorifer]